MLRKLFLATALLMAGALSGCSDPAPTDQAPTEAEFRAAIETTASCVVAKGFDADVNKGELPGDYTVGISFDGNVEPDDPEAVAAEAAYNECWAEHAAEISKEFQASQRLTGAERDQAMASLVTCLTGLGVTGVDVGQTDSTVFVSAIWEQLPEGSEEYMKAMDCMDRYRGVWPPGDKNNP